MVALETQQENAASRPGKWQVGKRIHCFAEMECLLKEDQEHKRNAYCKNCAADPSNIAGMNPPLPQKNGKESAVGYVVQHEGRLVVDVDMGEQINGEQAQDRLPENDRTENAEQGAFAQTPHTGRP